MSSQAAAAKQSKDEQAQDAEKQELAAADKQREKEAKAMARQRSTEVVLALVQTQSSNWHTLGAQQLVDAANDLLKPTPVVKKKGAGRAAIADRHQRGQVCIADRGSMSISLFGLGLLSAEVGPG